MTRRILSKFIINEISACDKPANSHARAIIMKGHDGDEGNNAMDSLQKVEKLLDITFDALVHDLRKREPGLTKEQAFSKVYCAPENVELRRIERGIAYKKMDATFAVARTAPQVLNEASVGIERGTSAYDELMKIANDERRRDPYNASLETIEQSFARVYSAPENRPLATRERAERFQRIFQGQDVQFGT